MVKCSSSTSQYATTNFNTSKVYFIVADKINIFTLSCYHCRFWDIRWIELIFGGFWSFFRQSCFFMQLWTHESSSGNISTTTQTKIASHILKLSHDFLILGVHSTSSTSRYCMYFNYCMKHTGLLYTQDGTIYLICPWIHGLSWFYKPYVFYRV